MGPLFLLRIASLIAGVISIAAPPFPFSVDIDDEPCTAEEIQNKPFDVTIFGAMGFMGQHALYYMLNHPDKPRWAVTGRNLNRLKYYLASNIGEAAAAIGTFEADLHNPESLRNVTWNSRVVVNFAGPYEAAGSEQLIHAAIVNCAHYVDLSSETKWKRYIHDRYSSKATSRQVAIVQSGGFESTASDLLATLAAQDLVNAGVPPPTHILVLWELANSGIDGTKQASSKAEVLTHGFVHDPYVLSPEVPFALRVDQTVDGHRNSSLGYNSLFKTQVMQYYPAYIDCPVIRRSLHKKFPDSAINVEEVCTTTLVEALAGFRKKLDAIDIAEKTKDGMKGLLLRKAIQPGEGPSVQVQNAGSFMGKAVAMYHPTSSGNLDGVIPLAQVAMEGRGDPYSTGSPKIAMELGLGLVVERMHRVGYITPSQVLGEQLLEQRLAKIDNGDFIRLRHGQ